MRLLTLDCETYDPNLINYGQGWAFKYNFPEMVFEVLGFGYRTHEGEIGYIDTNVPDGHCGMRSGELKLLEHLQNHDTILCHNAIYDIGALIYLFREELDLSKYRILDTQLMGKLVDQHQLSYSLDALTSFYKCGARKESDLLHDYAWSTGMYQKDHLDKSGRNAATRPSDNVLNKWCMSDMRRFPSEIVAEYCVKDVKATYSLYEILAPKLAYMDLTKYSDLIKVCIDIKKGGVRIDLARAKTLSNEFKAIAEDSANIVDKCLGCMGDTFNINSSKQLGEALLADGYDIPRTEKGAISLKSEWLEEQPQEIFKHIRRYRKALKVERDFIQKLFDYQEIIPEKYRENNKGWLFPSLKPLGATMTGRFTSGGGTGCKELSIHQIPRRDEEFGAPVRELFLPHEGEELLCCDFSSQESRLQVHYAKLLNCKGVQAIVDAWEADPAMKYHNKVAELTGLDYDTAKMINLALSYGMHTTKLSQKMGVTEAEGTRIIKQYHRLLPFMSQLQSIVARNILKLGYVKTLGGRKVFIDPPIIWDGKARTKESKGLSKLIQSSAADQCIESMISAWKAGLKILFSVHDEIIVSSSVPVAHLELLRLKMEHSYPLQVPMIADGGRGANWGKAK